MSTAVTVSVSQATGRDACASCYHHRSFIVQKEPALLGTLPLGSSVTGALLLVVSTRKHMGKQIQQWPGS